MKSSEIFFTTQKKELYNKVFFSFLRRRKGDKKKQPTTTTQLPLQSPGRCAAHKWSHQCDREDSCSDVPRSLSIAGTTGAEERRNRSEEP